MASEDDITPRKANRAHTSMLVWVLVAMLIAGLGGFGVTNFGRSVTAIGSVGGQEIDMNTYARALRNQVNALSKQFGQQLTLKEAQIFGVDQQVLTALIGNAALDNEAQRIGLSVGDVTVAQKVATDKNFSDVTGKFNKDTYKQLLDQARMTVKVYESGLRRDVARTVLQAAVVSGIVAPPPLTDTLLAYSGERRAFKLLSLTEATLPQKLPAPTEADLKAYYDAHLDAFTRPEAKRITYAVLQPMDLAPTMSVDEADIQALYDSRLADYVVPEKRLVERLVYPSDAEAAAAYARLDAGETFETLVKDRGLDLTDIDLGDVTVADLGAAGAAVFALTAPGVVGPLQSDLGPALFRMNAILAAQNTPLSDVHDSLASEVQLTAATKAVAEKATEIDDALAGGATLEDLAKDHGLTLGTTDYVTGADDNDAIAADRAFLTAADKVQAGDYPEATMLTSGGLMALRLDQMVPPTPVPFDKAHDKVAAAFHTDALAAALNAKGETAQTAVAAGASLGTQGVVDNVAASTRDATVATPDVLKAVFEMTEGEVRLLTTADFTGLIQLTHITPVDPASDDAKAARANLATQTQQSIAQDMYELFTNAMTAQGVLTIDQTAINSVLSQMN